MGKKKTTSATANLQALKIGSRVRYSGDGDNVEGRITWANATHVKIKWDDGEQVTWKRADLASKPITIIDAHADQPQPSAAPSADQSQPEPAPAPAITEATAEAETQQPDAAMTPAASEPTEAQPAAPVAEPAVEPAASAETTPATAKPKRQRKATAAPKEKKLSCLDAAAKVLGETGQPMTCQEMIDAMAKKGYWSSPGGQTPAATLYSAILRELTNKGADSRFVKTERGKFGPKS
jgi:hypothetical protein